LSNVTISSSSADFGSKPVLYSNEYDSAGLFPSAASYPGLVVRSNAASSLYHSNGSTWRLLPTSLISVSNGAGDNLTIDSDVILNFAGGDGVNVTKTNDNTLTISSDPSWSFNIVLADGDSGYAFRPDSRFFLDSDIDPTLYLRRGETYNFNLSAPSEPFYIKTAQSTGTGDQYTDGVTGNGTQFGTVTFQPPMNAPSTLYYASSVSGTHTGTINIV